VLGGIMDSNIVNKYIKKYLTPFLIESGYEKITDRKYIKTVDVFDYRIEIKSVGNYFSSVSGWTSQSFYSNGGVFCNVIKPWYKWENHFQIKNLCSINQTQYKEKLITEPEKNRDDIWWIDDNSNLEETINDLKESIKKYSFKFFRQFEKMTVVNMIDEIKKEHDGQKKYFRLYYLYKHIGFEKEMSENELKFMEENKRLRLKNEL
jgi:hypothetical protein